MSAGSKSSESVKQRFEAALDALVQQARQDRSVLAAILCGSLSHDAVWAKSDIDLLFVVIDDKKTQTSERALYADGVNVHAWILPRAEFRKLAEGAIRNSFLHSLVAKGRLLFSHDDSIAELFGELREIGERDTNLQLLAAGCHALPSLYKAHKWLLTRGDLEYTALWILWAANALARIEILHSRQLLDREALPQAMRLNPDFFRTIYTDLLNHPKTRSSVESALAAIDHYLAEHAPSLFREVLLYLEEAGEARSSTDIEDHFRRNFGIEGVTGACEYLADQGLIGKASLPVLLTKKSNVNLEELAFFALSRHEQ